MKESYDSGSQDFRGSSLVRGPEAMQRLRDRVSDEIEQKLKRGEFSNETCTNTNDDEDAGTIIPKPPENEELREIQETGIPLNPSSSKRANVKRPLYDLSGFAIVGYYIVEWLVRRPARVSWKLVKWIIGKK